MNVRFVKSYLLHGANNIHTTHTKMVWQSKYRSHTAYGVGGFCFSFVQANSVQAEFLELKIMVLMLKKSFHQKYKNFIKREWSRKSAKVPCRQSAFWQTEKAKPHTKFLLIRIYTLEIMQKRSDQNTDNVSN